MYMYQDDIIRELIGYGADPSDLYDHFKSILTDCKQNYPFVFCLWKCRNWEKV